MAGLACSKRPAAFLWLHERGEIASAIAQRRDAGELRAEKYDLRRVIGPQKQDQQRTGGSVGRGQAGPAEVNSQHGFSDGEEQGGHRRSQPDMSHPHRSFGEQPEEQGKQRRDDQK